MTELTNEAGAARAFKKSWGVGAGSVSAELQSAAEQIIADSRLPGSNLNALLNAFFADYLVWPFRATPGKAYDAVGAESAELGSLIYTASQDLRRVPADALACAIETHQTLGLRELRTSYDKIAKVKALAKSSVPKISSDTPVADATMGIIFAADSSVPLEALAEELEQLNKTQPNQHWVDMVVVLSRGTINYGCQFPDKPLNDLLPSARNTKVRAAMYVHIVAKAHTPFCLNRMCTLLFYYLYLFSPGTGLPPSEEMMEGVPQMGMTIASYQQNLSGQLVPVPLELRFNQFFLFPIGFRAVDGRGEELARVRYLPWQDGGVVRVTGKLPIESILIFAGKEAVSQMVIRLKDEQFSGVIPLSRQGFIEMADRMAKQSTNIYIKPDPRPNWIVENRGSEGTASPFIARLFLGICRLRDQALSDAKVREQFDVAFEAVLNGLESVRAASSELVKTFTEYQQQLARGEGVQITGNVAHVDKKRIDREIRTKCDEVIGTTCRVLKDRMQILLRTLGLDIGFLYQRDGAYATGQSKMRQEDAALADYLQQTRTEWSEHTILCRNNFEHTIAGQLKVKLQFHGNSVTAPEPQVEGQPVTFFVNRITDRVCCFVEDLLAHVLQSHLPAGISIGEIPVTERKPEIVERFRPALIGGGTPLWTITYHDSKFEEH
jgi:hypothetical protein